MQLDNIRVHKFLINAHGLAAELGRRAPDPRVLELADEIPVYLLADVADPYVAGHDHRRFHVRLLADPFEIDPDKAQFFPDKFLEFICIDHGFG